MSCAAIATCCPDVHLYDAMHHGAIFLSNLRVTVSVDLSSVSSRGTHISSISTHVRRLVSGRIRKATIAPI